MKKQYPSPLAATVLERKRMQQRRNVVFYLQLVFILSFIGGELVNVHYRRKLEAEQRSPTWAGFAAMKQDDKLYEFVHPIDSKGVPTHLMINGESWSVVQANHFYDVDLNIRGAVPGLHVQGQTNCKGKVISYIVSDQPQIMRINLMHEVFHAGACLHGGDTWWNSVNPNEHDHPGVYHLGEFMANFAHDNPEFIKWEISQ